MNNGEIGTDGGIIWSMNTYSIFRSKTFWTTIVTFVVMGGNAILPMIPETYSVVVGGLLLILANVFHLDTAKKFGATN